MEPNKEKTNENNDKALERAEVFNGDLPADTTNKDLFSNEIENLEETLGNEKNKVQDDKNDSELANRLASYFENSHESGGSPGSQRGHVTDPAHDHRLKQNHDRSDNSVEHDDDKEQEDDADNANEAYERAQQMKIQEHKRLLEQQQGGANTSKDLAFRQHQVNMQNAHSPTASVLNKVRNHEIFGSEMSRRITNKPTIASLNNARTWLKEKILVSANESEKKELYLLMSKVASLLVEAGALNLHKNG